MSKGTEDCEEYCAELLALNAELLTALKDCMDMSLFASPKWDAVIAKAEGRGYRVKPEPREIWVPRWESGNLKVSLTSESKSAANESSTGPAIHFREVIE